MLLLLRWARSIPDVETSHLPRTGFNRRRGFAPVLLSGCIIVCAAVNAFAQEVWTLSTVVHEALSNRKEIAAAQARVDAASARPAIVSALEDPMLSPSIDHFPFKEMDTGTAMQATPDMNAGTPSATPNQPAEGSGRRFNWSIGVEQKFPLSRLLSHRRRAAEADVVKESAAAEKTALDVELEASKAFFMVQERRRMGPILEQQIELAGQLKDAASARYASGTGNQSEVLRAEVEIARLEALQRALGSEIRSAETMLNANIGREPSVSVPPLQSPPLDMDIPSVEQVSNLSTQRSPELQGAAAEIGRASADVDAMRSMYAPMGMVRFGYASTMAEGSGAMVMLGVSLPIWREKLRQGVAEARAMESMASYDRVAMERMIESEAMSARADLEAAQIKYLALRDDVVPRALRLVDPSLAFYASGQGTLAAVIEAVQALWAAQQESVMAEAELGVAWARLNRTTVSFEE